jgi:hypothetical protein
MRYNRDFKQIFAGKYHNGAFQVGAVVQAVGM